METNIETHFTDKFGLVDPLLGKSDYRMGYESGFIKGTKWQQKQFKKIIDRLQEKYDENGYDYCLLIKLQRIESHFDLTTSIYSDLLKKSYSEEDMIDFAKYCNLKDDTSVRELLIVWFEHIKNKIK